MKHFGLALDNLLIEEHDSYYRAWLSHIDPRTGGGETPMRYVQMHWDLTVENQPITKKIYLFDPKASTPNHEELVATMPLLTKNIVTDFALKLLIQDYSQDLYEDIFLKALHAEEWVPYRLSLH